MRFLKILILIFLSVAAIGVLFLKPLSIPHKIHYVWIGSKEVPPSVAKAIESWRKYMPDWEIIRWDERNCPIFKSAYARKMRRKKQVRYVSDFCRYYALEKYGGLYLDTDMFLTDSVEKYLTEPLVMVLERKNYLSGGIFAVAPHHKFSKKMLEFYYNHKGSIPIDVPALMTVVFYKLYPTASLAKNYYKKGQLAVYEPNYMMLDFGGPENAAEHWYATGRTNFVSRGAYYDFFSKWFLDAYGKKLTDDNPEPHYAVLLPNHYFYIVEWVNKRWWKVRYGVYSFEKGILILKYENMEKRVYLCQMNKCVWLAPVESVAK